jgi:hypothetical protein
LETGRVQGLVINAPIARAFKTRLGASKAVGQIAFPGYGSGGFREQALRDSRFLMAFSVEVPRADKERYFVFSEKDGIVALIDDFVHPAVAGLVQGIARRGDSLVYRTIDGREMLVRPYPGTR